MERWFLSLSSVLVACSLTLNANPLIQSAKDNGLVPLPKNQKEVDKVLREMGVEYEEFHDRYYV